MDCAKAKDLTARAVSGNASPADDAALRAHAAACPACAEALTRARKVWTLMGRLPATAASRPVDPLTLTRRRPIPLWAAGVAAAVVLAAAGLILFRPTPPGPVADRPAREVEPAPAPPAPEHARQEPAVPEKTEVVRVPAPPEDVKPAPAAPEKKPEPLVAQPVPAPVPAPPTPPAKKTEETAKTEPLPVPPVAPKPVVPARETLPTAATVDRAEGQVVATINGETVPVSASFRLTDADAIATLGKGSQAVLAYEDGTRIVLGADTSVGRVLRRENEG